MPEPAGSARGAKEYSRARYCLVIAETLLLLVLLLIFAASGLSKALARIIINTGTPGYLILPLYLLIIAAAYYLLNLPLNFYRSYTLEHKFGLSSQRIGNWLSDEAKSGLISYLIGIILLSAFYYILRMSPGYWWVLIWLFWIVFSLFLARLTPVLIIPLFFKYKVLSDDSLRQRIIALAEKMRVKLLDVFEIDFSKKTLKANAAFVGMGRTRRVILADTLKDKYTHDEIEVILAHEFAHYKLKHLFQLIAFGCAVSLVCFYLIFRTGPYVLGLFGFGSLSDIAALPVVMVYFVLFGVITQPLSNAFSRRLEREADKMALAVTADRGAFISMMEKLARQNLADRSPHPLIKFFFLDHPPIDERIASAK